MGRRLGLALAFLLTACAAEPGEPTPSRTVPVALDHSAPAVTDAPSLIVDGNALPLRIWLPVDDAGRDTAPRAAIVALHGFNDHNTAFEMPAEIWRHEGIATFAYDQDGFGANPDHGRWPGSAALVRELATAIAMVRTRFPGVPVYALGESMGGAVVLDAIGGHTGVKCPRPDGVILVAPAVWARSTMAIYERVALWAAVRVIPSMTFTGEGFHVQPSDNIPMLRGLGRDPLFIKATRVDAIYGLVDLMDAAFAAAPNDRVPTLLLTGAHDELIPRDATDTVIGVLPKASDVAPRVAYYESGWHMLLRDLEYRLVADDVAAWIANRDKPLPSGADRAATLVAAGKPENETTKQ